MSRAISTSSTPSFLYTDKTISLFIFFVSNMNSSWVCVSECIPINVTWKSIDAVDADLKSQDSVQRIVSFSPLHLPRPLRPFIFSNFSFKLYKRNCHFYFLGFFFWDLDDFFFPFFSFLSVFVYFLPFLGTWIRPNVLVEFFSMCQMTI